MRALVLLSAAMSLAACTSTYHPEYHPVTLTNYEQHVSYPASGRAPRAAPTLVAPAPPAPQPPPPWSAWPNDPDPGDPSE